MVDLDLSLRNMTFSKDDWQTQEGKLSMNASEFIYGSLHLFDPIINAEFSPQGVALRQFTSRWEGGYGQNVRKLATRRENADPR